MAASGHDMFRMALASLQAGRSSEAEALFKQLLARHPGHAAARNLFGILLMQLGRFEEAEQQLRSALRRGSPSETTLYNYAIVLKALGRPAEALQRLDEALAINPAVAETWNNRGTVLNDLKRYGEAVEAFDRALAIRADYAEAHSNKGKSLAELRRHEAALAAYEQALARAPDLAEAWLGRANSLAALKRSTEALAAYERALALKPELAEAWIGLGNTLVALNRHVDARAAFDRALALKPSLAAAWLGRGNVASARGDHEEALATFDRALTLQPDLAEAWVGRGNVHTARRSYADAVAAYDEALRIDPGLAGAWVGRGNALAELQRHEAAAAAYEQALVAIPDLVDAWLGRGNVLVALRRCDEALAAFDKALELDPALAGAWVGRGNALSERRQHAEALAAYEKALALDAGLAEAWYGQGNVFLAFRRDDDALRAFERALELKPELAEAWLGRGMVLTRHNLHADAFAAFDRAFALKPELPYLEGYRLHAKQHLCDWTGLEAEFDRLLDAVRAGRPASVPFPLLSMPSTVAEQVQCARRHLADLPAFPPLWRGERYTHDRIRVAYVSSDFHDHAVAHLMVGVFEQHDRSCFEMAAISTGPDRDSEIRRRIKSSLEHFIDVHSQRDQEVAELLRRHEFDIVVDLNGFTGDARYDIFARRPAPLQVNYLGYPAAIVDYTIADATVIPDNEIALHSERIVWLPECYLANAPRPISERIPARQECGLPEEAFVFCCFNNAYKILPAMFHVWMRLLAAVENSVLWLAGGHPLARDNLRREAARCGIAPERLVFADRVPSMADHLARYRQADLFLDTLPFNAHVTASDALWAGVPVLTCLGSAFAGRVAASLLKTLDLPELIAPSLEAYEATALQLAREPHRLAALKARLAQQSRNGPLFNPRRFARHLEAAYATMWERQRRGQPAEGFSVAPIG